MSSFNAQLEGGPLSANRRMAAGTDIPHLPGQTDASYREATLPLNNAPDLTGVNQLSEIQQALHLIGRDVSQYGNYVEHDRAEREHMENLRARDTQHKIAQDDAARKHEDVLLRGQGVRDAREFVAKYHNDAVNNRMPYPASSADVPGRTDYDIQQAVSAHVQELGGPDSPAAKAYVEGFENHAGPMLDTILYSALDRNQKIVREQTLSYAADSAIDAKDKDGLDHIAENLRGSGLDFTDEQIKHAVGVSAMTSAARAGDEAKFKAAEEFLGGRFADIPIRLQPQLEAVVQRRQNEANKAFIDNVAARAITGTDQDQNAGMPYPFDVQEKMARDKAAELNVPDHILKQALDGIDSNRRAEKSRIDKQIEQNAITDGTSQIQQGVLQHMLDADTTGGAATLDRYGADESNAFKFQLPSGKEHTVPFRQTIQQATSAAMQSLNPNVPLTTPTPERVHFLTSNGVTFSPWQAVMRSGSELTAADASFIDKATGQPNIPANSRAGFAMYEQLTALDKTGRLAARMLDNPRAEQFYDTAMMARKWNPTGNTPEEQMNNALARAAVGMRKGRLSDESMGKLNKIIREDIGSTFANAGNRIEVYNEATKLADYYMRVGDAPMDAAADQALKKIGERYQMSGRWAIDMGNNHVPPNLGTFAESTIDNYLKANPKGGIDKNDLTLIPAPVEGGWMLFNQATFSPVPNWQKTGFFTTSDIIAHGKALEGKAHADAAAAREAIIQRLARPSGIVPGAKTGMIYQVPSEYSGEKAPSEGYGAVIH